MEYILIGIIIIQTVLLVVLLIRSRPQKDTGEDWQTKLLEEQQKNDNLIRENATLTGRIENSLEVYRKLEADLKILREEKDQLIADLNSERANNKNLQEDLKEQQQSLEKTKKELMIEFENLAGKILKQNTEEFSNTNKEKLDTILKPFRENLEAFKQKVEATHKEELEARGSLKQELKQLMELNSKMSEEANNLTRALKGESKTQGNWGEVILERILERSGLTKGREYEIQTSVTTEEGRRLQPDVVIHLPDEKYMIIDAKVTLTAYERYVSAQEEEEADEALKMHLTSIRSHVKGLSEKNYQQLHGAQSPDFVLLFVPIEPAFGLALQHDADLYNEAFDKNIVIVSPSTLLATLATINSVWKQEYQNKNAIEIAERGGKLYDKFVGFLDSMENIGQRIRQSQESYDEAMLRLSSGSGNLIGQAEKIRKLGAKASKKIPESLFENKDD